MVFIYDVSVSIGIFTYKHDVVIPIGTRVKVKIRKKLHIGVVVRSSTNKLPLSRVKAIESIIDHVVAESHVEWLLRIASIYKINIHEVITLSLSSHIFKDQYCNKELYFFVKNKGEHGVRLVNRLLKSDRAISTPLTYRCDLKTLYPSQLKVFNSIVNSLHVAPTLLHGVTGSGKTEIYCHLINRVLIKNKQVLVMLPEINLLEPMYQYLTMAFPHTAITTFSSSVPLNKRYAKIKSIMKGDTSIIVGTRSAAFLHIPNLELMIIDEEHDSSFVQQVAPYYSAISICNQRKLPLILGSATPSMKSFYYCLRKIYKYISLEINAALGCRKKHNIQVVACDNKDSSSSSFPDEVHQHISTALKRRQQILVVHNKLGNKRLGYCNTCQQQIVCGKCQRPLILVSEPTTRFYCSTCNRYYLVRCRLCQRNNMIFQEYGIEEVYNNLAQRYPGYSIMRIDSTNYNKYQIDAIKQQKVSIIISTQILAKGHDFKNIELLVVSDVSSSISLRHISRLEQTLQLIHQATGRVGRHTNTGLTLIPISCIDTQIAQLIKTQSYSSIASTLLKLAHAQRIPPFYPSVTIVGAAGSTKTTSHEMLQQARTIAASELEKVQPLREVFDPRQSKIITQFTCFAKNYNQLIRAITAIEVWNQKHKKKLQYNLHPSDF